MPKRKKLSKGDVDALLGVVMRAEDLPEDQRGRLEQYLRSLGNPAHRPRNVLNKIRDSVLFGEIGRRLPESESLAEAIRDTVSEIEQLCEQYPRLSKIFGELDEWKVSSAYQRWKKTYPRHGNYVLFLDDGREFPTPD